MNHWGWSQWTNCNVITIKHLIQKRETFKNWCLQNNKDFNHYHCLNWSGDALKTRTWNQFFFFFCFQFIAFDQGTRSEPTCSTLKTPPTLNQKRLIIRFILSFKNGSLTFDIRWFFFFKKVRNDRDIGAWR